MTLSIAAIIGYVVGTLFGLVVGYKIAFRALPHLAKLTTLSTFEWMEENGYAVTKMKDGEKIFVKVVEKPQENQ
jgi:predicted MFS family arabinose efflux permease